MPKLGSARTIPPPSSRTDDDWERPRVYPSPDGEWALRFSDPYEFAMGGYLWHATLSTQGADVIPLPNADAPENMEPWSSDSRMFAYTRYEPRERVSRLELRGVDGSTPSVPGGGFLITAQWAPKESVLLAVGVSEVTVLDETGAVVSVVAGSGVEDEWPVTGWCPSGGHFFVLARTSTETASEIRFYSVDAKEVERYELDPAELVPYDAEPYRKLRRDFWSLESGSGTGCVGSFLDRWSSSRYEQARGELQLGVHRPTTPPFAVKADWGDEWVCRAEERWIAVELIEKGSGPAV